MQEEVILKKCKMKEIQDRVKEKLTMEEKIKLELFVENQQKIAIQEQKILAKREKDILMIQKKVSKN